MLGMFTDSAKLFFKGKLFKENGKAASRLALGAGIGLAAGLVVGLVAPVWLAAIVAGGVAGVAQPILLKDVKYA